MFQIDAAHTAAKDRSPQREIRRLATVVHSLMKVHQARTEQGILHLESLECSPWGLFFRVPKRIGDAHRAERMHQYGGDADASHRLP